LDHYTFLCKFCKQIYTNIHKHLAICIEKVKFDKDQHYSSIIKEKYNEIQKLKDENQKLKDELNDIKDITIPKKTVVNFFNKLGSKKMILKNRFLYY